MYPSAPKLLPIALAAALLCAASPAAQAANAVTLQNWNGGVGNAPTLGIGDTLTATKNLPKSNWSDNPNLNFSAWAHAGGSPWWTFQLTSTADVSIVLAPADSGASFKPAMTVWAAGNEPFDGGFSAVTEEVASNGWDSPHSFNAVGQIGNFGTYWMSANGGTVYSNMKQTLAYANAGEGHTGGDTGWGEIIETGIHDMSINNTFENGVSGTVGTNSVSLLFNDLQPGWYVVFAGGADDSLSTTSMNLQVAAVPEPETWAMLLAGLALTGLRLRRRAV